jgi:HEAT repeat protein
MDTLNKMLVGMLIVGIGADALAQTTVAGLVQRLEQPGLRDEERAHLALRLGETGDRSALGPLEMLARDRAVLVRRAATRALGSLGVPRVVPLLRELIDEDKYVVHEATNGLASYPSKETREHLRKVSGDRLRPDWVRAAASEAASAVELRLRRLVERQRVLSLRRASAPRALKQKGDPVAPAPAKHRSARATKTTGGIITAAAANQAASDRRGQRARGDRARRR